MLKTLTLTLLSTLVCATMTWACPVSSADTAMLAPTEPRTEVRTQVPPSQESEQATLEQIKGDPEAPKNRDLDKDIERTYDQKGNIESDYGKEIEKEILESPDSNDEYRQSQGEK